MMIIEAVNTKTKCNITRNTVDRLINTQKIKEKI